MVRRIPLTLTIMGLVTSIGVWVASYCYECGFAISRTAPQGWFAIAFRDGWFAYSHVPGEIQVASEDDYGWRIDILTSEGEAWIGPHRHLGMRLEINALLDVLQLPLYMLATPFILSLGVLSIPWWRRWRRGRRGFCLACGYDLTGNVTGACPECGAEVVVEGTPPVE